MNFLFVQAREIYQMQALKERISSRWTVPNNSIIILIGISKGIDRHYGF